MPLPLTVSNGVKVYNLVENTSKPDWSNSSGKESRRKKDVDFRSRVDLIQGLNFPSSCGKIRISTDKKFLMATGNYKPRVKVFELSQLALKFERYIDSDVIDFLVLSEDFAKLAFLRNDRVLEFHTQFGCHYKTKIPKNGRCLLYNPFNSDMIIPSSSDQIYRLNLEEGRFKASFESTLGGTNDGVYHKTYNFYAFGGENGFVECFDPREKSAVCQLDVSESLKEFDSSQSKNLKVTKLAFDEKRDSLKMAVGTDKGKVLLFDVRMAKPLHVKDHRNEQPVIDLAFHSSGKLVSSDSNAIKLWDLENEKIFTSIIPPAEINSFCLFPDSGVVFAACEDKKIQSYFIPELGEAPRWCSFLDSITEELEEQKTKTVYDDFKFVTKDDLEKMESSKLIGTEALRPYMHGYFMSYRHYAKIKATISKAEMADHLKNSRKAKLENKLREKINSARRISKKGSSNNKKESVVEDDRFKRMFENEDFEIDTRSAEFRTQLSSKAKKGFRSKDS